ncbi:MAG: vWA domain-containing protein [Akkermansiaceae bacterium]
MSQHAQLSPEAEQQLRAQKRNSTISAIIISLLSCALLVAILFYIALATISKNTEELVTYSSGVESEEKITKPEMTDQVQKKPSSPSASMAKVIASSTPSPTAVPVPDVTITEPSLDFGDGNDFGDGWGSGTGSGSGGGGVSFFKQSVKAERIAYVIDYSASMRGKKFELMKKELAKSVRDLPDTVDYQLIFFAGPAWVAGDEIHGGGKGQAASFTRDGKKYAWKGKGSAGVPPAEWIRSDKEQRKKSLKIIKDTPMIYGTKWDRPIEYALEMNPQPDIIFFMTDGTAGKNTEDIAKQIGRDAKKKGVIINCIALMEPKAKDAMADIAKRTGGIFTEVQENGRTKQHDLK